MAKLIRISNDSGTTWRTFPGNTGDLGEDSSSADDTVFGQTFASNQPTIRAQNMTAQAFYKGFAGYNATLKKQGTPTAATAEAMSLVSGKTYQIDDTTKRIWNRNDTVTVYDNAVDHTADVVAIDYLFGTVTFDSGYTVTTPVTIDVTYYPTTVLGKASSYTLTQTADAIQTTDFATAQANGGVHTYDPGLRTVSLELGGFFDTANGFISNLVNNDELIIEINPDGNSLSIARGFFRASSRSQSGDVGALEEETVTFTLTVPTDATGGGPAPEFPFNWGHDATTTLHESLQWALDAWLGELKYDFQYLEDGTNGQSFTGVITDISLSSSLDGMNEFSIGVAVDGAYTAVP